ncbi:MAG: hypothetical protein ACRDH7_06405 [Actinomycetota bacterium]
MSALRKPTVAAWAVDRLSNDHPRDIEALIQAGKDLASAQRRVAAGGSAERMLEVSSERRRLVDKLVRASSEALGQAGLSAARATLDKVSHTLMAIATDPEAAERVRSGTLDKELPAPAGFGDERSDAALLASVSELPKRKERKVDARDERLTAEAAELERIAKDLESEAKLAQTKAVAAARTAGTARKRADAARARVDRPVGPDRLR